MSHRCYKFSLLSLSLSSIDFYLFMFSLPNFWFDFCFSYLFQIFQLYNTSSLTVPKSFRKYNLLFAAVTMASYSPFLFYIKNCYCVIVYFCHFWSPAFIPILVQSLLYMPNSLVFKPIIFLRHPLCLNSLHKETNDRYKRLYPTDTKWHLLSW